MKPGRTTPSRSAHDPRAKRDARDARAQEKRDPRARKRDDRPDAKRGTDAKRDPRAPKRDARPESKGDTRAPRGGDAKRDPRGGDARRDPHGGDARRDPRTARGGDAKRDARETKREAPPKPVPRGKPLAGTWIFTTRPGAEIDLVEELELALGTGRARVIGPSLVESDGAPTFAEGDLDVTFGRQGFVRTAVLDGASADELAAAIATAAGKEEFALLSWVPDSDATNPLATKLEALEEAAIAALPEDAAKRRIAVRALEGRGGRLVQLTIDAKGRAYVGYVDAGLALSLAPGGRSRMRVGGERPSRAARKVEEALAWLGSSPGSGEVCVDLGAAPGGWTWVLLEKRAQVIAVDPALLRPDIAARKGLRHVQASAFTFSPDEPVDWLFCDMAWRPLEVAQLLAKWGRRRWTRTVVSNVKLPMKKKAAMVSEVRAIVEAAGFTRVRTRQLYHDREEITLTAWLR